MPQSIYKEFPPEQRFIIQYWDWKSKELKEAGRRGSYEEAEKLLDQLKDTYSTGRIIEVRKFFTDQY